MSSSAARALAGLATVIALGAIVALSLTLFAGGFTDSVPVTVKADRVGLVMNPQAKVRMRGVQVGTVESIDTEPDGQASIKLAMDPGQLKLIPSNVLVDITSPTVFGAKYVELLPPPNPSSQALRAGQVLDTKSVTVEVNTVFQQLTSLLQKIDPVQLNQTLGTLRVALGGRGEALGKTVTELDQFLARTEPTLPDLSRDLELSPAALNAYGDAAPDLVNVLQNTTRLSKTVVDEQQNLDTFLISATNLADVGNDVLGNNRQPLANVLHMLSPTTDLTNKYADGLRCGLQGLIPFVTGAQTQEPGIAITAGFTLGVERYKYPNDLPKVAATGGPKCKEMMLPFVPAGKAPPFLVADVGANPFEYGNQGIVVNSDGLKQALYGPIDGPPRNSAQIGQPG